MAWGADYRRESPERTPELSSRSLILIVLAPPDRGEHEVIDDQLVPLVAGATQPAAYNLPSLTLNGQARLEVVGPIVLTLNNGTSRACHALWELLAGRVPEGHQKLAGGATPGLAEKNRETHPGGVREISAASRTPLGCYRCPDTVSGGCTPG